MKMPFGRYGPQELHPNGVDLIFVPSWYLKWLVKQNFMIEKHDELLAEVEKMLAERDARNSHFDDDVVKVKEK